MPADIPVPEPRQAIYAGKFPSPPAELNTLVPEDFNFMDFNFKSLKSQPKENEVIKTDNTFENIITSEEAKDESKEIATETEKKIELIEAKKTEDKTGIDKSLVLGAAVATTAAVATAAAVVSGTSESKEAEKNSAPVDTDKEPVAKSSAFVPIIDEKPLIKVSEARKSLEPTNKTEALATKSEPTVNVDMPKSKVEQPDRSEAPVAGAAVIAGAAAIAATTAAIVSSDKTKVIPEEVPKPKEVEKSDTSKTSKVEEMVKPCTTVALDEPKQTAVQEVIAPAPLPTNTSHLVAARESLKPSLLPVKPVNGAPSTDSDGLKTSSPLTKSTINSEELEKLRKQLDQQKILLEKEIDSKKMLESQIQAMISKSNAQDEALRYKNESLDQLQSDYLKTNNDLTAAKNEKEKLKEALLKAESELAATSEKDTKAFLEKSDEVAGLKDKLAEFAAIIGQKNKEIDSLQRQLEEAKRSNMQTALENVQKYETFEDDLIKMVEEEILRMQDTIDEQREYNAKLQMEVDSEYAFWKAKLSKNKN